MEFVRTCLTKHAPQHLPAFTLEDPFRPTFNVEDLAMLYELPDGEAFLKSLHYYDKLKEFLDLTLTKLPAEAGLELIRIAQQMLAHFEKSKDDMNSI